MRQTHSPLLSKPLYAASLSPIEKEVLQRSGGKPIHTAHDAMLAVAKFAGFVAVPSAPLPRVKSLAQLTEQNVGSEEKGYFQNKDAAGSSPVETTQVVSSLNGRAPCKQFLFACSPA